MSTTAPTPSPSHLSYREFLAAWISEHRGDPDVTRTLEQYRDALLTLWHLDLGPIEPLLRATYAPSPRGGHPWDPVAMLRALQLSHLLGDPAIHRWVARLSCSSTLRAMCGFFGDSRPGIGTFYDFLHRLHDGYATPGTRERKPSEIERARSREPRPMLARPVIEAPPSEDTSKTKSKKKRKKSKTLTEPKAEGRWSVAAALAKVLGEQGRGRPEGLDRRLADILWQGGVLPSRTRGLIPDDLQLAGDGSPLVTHAWGLGTRVCAHGWHERCTCDRRYADPDAERGFDAYRKTYFYGHKFYEIIAPQAGLPGLPVITGLHPASANDQYAAPVILDTLAKINADYGSPLRVTHFIADAGHDSEAFAAWLLARGVTPVIALSGSVPKIHPNRPDLPLSDRAIPLCEAGVEMASWGTAGPGRPVFVCPVKAGKIDRCSKAPPEDPGWVCKKGDLAPIVTLRTEENPRLFPPISRNSHGFGKRYATRSGCERSNAMKKVAYELEACGHRRASFWKIRIGLMALLQHGAAWVRDLSAEELVKSLLGEVSSAAA